jgi:hypothetical protein
MYVLFSALQIKFGKNTISTKLINFDSLFSKIGNMVYNLVPLVRETNSLIEYSSIQTCLSFGDWFLLQDIIYYIYDAKFVFVKDHKNKPGKKKSTLFGFIMLVVMLLLLLAPTFIYNQWKFKATHKIKSGSFEIDLMEGKTRKIFNLFSSSTLLTNRAITNQEAEQVFKTTEFKKFKAWRLNVIEFSKTSDEFLNLTPQILSNMDHYLTNNNKKYLR